MRRILIALLLIGVFCSYVFADYALQAPTVDESNYKQFTQWNQYTDEPFLITSIDWVSASGAEIAATDGFILRDGSDKTIVSCEATAVSDQCHFTYPDGISVNGMEAYHLSSGYLYIYGKRR